MCRHRTRLIADSTRSPSAGPILIAHIRTSLSAIAEFLIRQGGPAVGTHAVPRTKALIFSEPYTVFHGDCAGADHSRITTEILCSFSSLPGLASSNQRGWPNAHASVEIAEVCRSTVDSCALVRLQSLVTPSANVRSPGIYNFSTMARQCFDHRKPTIRNDCGRITALVRHR